MAVVRAYAGRLGLAGGRLVGLSVGALWWAAHADAGAVSSDAAYTAITPCVVFDSRVSQGATGAFTRATCG